MLSGTRYVSTETVIFVLNFNKKNIIILKKNLTQSRLTKKTVNI